MASLNNGMLYKTPHSNTNIDGCVWLHVSILVILSTQRRCLTWKLSSSGIGSCQVLMVTGAQYLEIDK